ITNRSFTLFIKRTVRHACHNCCKEINQYIAPACGAGVRPLRVSFLVEIAEKEDSVSSPPIEQCALPVPSDLVQPVHSGDSRRFRRLATLYQKANAYWL